MVISNYTDLKKKEIATSWCGADAVLITPDLQLATKITKEAKLTFDVTSYMYKVVSSARLVHRAPNKTLSAPYREAGQDCHPLASSWLRRACASSSTYRIHRLGLFSSSLPNSPTTTRWLEKP